MRDPEVTTTGTVIGQSSHKHFINAANHPTDNNLIAVCNRYDDGISIFDLRNPNRPLLSQFLEADLTGVAWNPNGTSIAAIGYRKAYVGQVGSDECSHFTHPQYLNKATIKNICWIGDSMIAAGSNSGNVHLWNTNKADHGIVLHRLDINTRHLTEVLLDPFWYNSYIHRPGLPHPVSP